MSAIKGDRATRDRLDETKRVADAPRRRGSSPARHVEHLTTSARVARGKAARAAVPRSSHAAWAPPADRRDPVVLLEEQASTRMPELVSIRYGRMLVSPFTFYRGAACVMASDLADAPRTGLQVQLCGDAHLSNFGGFAAPDLRLVFSINDFDETLPGPFEWDLKLLVASFAVAGRDRSFDATQRTPINLAVTRAYREVMRGFASMRELDVRHARLDIDDIRRRWAGMVSGEALRTAERHVARARGKTSLKALDKLTELIDGRAPDRQRPRPSWCRSRSSPRPNSCPTSICASVRSSAPTDARWRLTAAGCSSDYRQLADAAKVGAITARSGL